MQQIQQRYIHFCHLLLAYSITFKVPTQSITFDQPFYAKAYNIVSSMNMNTFVVLEGFHQLKSFLESIGCLMEGGGLCAALENVYAPVTVGHKFSGKAFSLAIRSHMLCALAVFITSLRNVFRGKNSISKNL